MIEYHGEFEICSFEGNLLISNRDFNPTIIQFCGNGPKIDFYNLLEENSLAHPVYFGN